MSIWTPLDSQAAVEHFMEVFGGFHDACLREASLGTESWIDPDGSMACPGHLDTSIVLFFQSSGAREPAVELQCEGVSLFRVMPTGENCDSILGGASFGPVGDGVRLEVYYVGAPLNGEPSSWTHRRITDDDTPGIEVVAQAMAWRPVIEGLGSTRRYAPARD